MYDVDLDGDVDDDDVSLVDGQLMDGAVLRTDSSVGNPYLFTGRPSDTLCATSGLVSEDASFRRIQDNRNRTRATYRQAPQAGGAARGGISGIRRTRSG